MGGLREATHHSYLRRPGSHGSPRVVSLWLRPQRAHRRHGQAGTRDEGRHVRPHRLRLQQLYVFAPSTTQKRIHRALGFEWSDPEGIELRDNISLLVFVSDGKVVKYVAQPRDRGDFADLDVGSPWTPATAAFVVAADGQATDGQPYLVMKPTS